MYDWRIKLFACIYRKYILWVRCCDAKCVKFVFADETNKIDI